MARSTWLEDAKRNSGLLIFLGALTVVLGIIAIATPYLVGVTVSVFVGFMLLGSGIAQIVHAFKSRQWGTGVWGTVIGTLGVGAGVVMIFRPAVGLLSMTLLLAFYFLIDGISEIIAAFKIKPDRGWGWVMFNGVIAVLLGFMIWRQWPISGAWAIGVLVGIHILFSGWAMIVLGTGARRLAGVVEDAVEDAVDYGQDLAEDAVDAAQDVVEKAGDVVDGAVDKVGDTFRDDKG